MKINDIRNYRNDKMKNIMNLIGAGILAALISTHVSANAPATWFLLNQEKAKQEEAEQAEENRIAQEEDAIKAAKAFSVSNADNTTKVLPTAIIKKRLGYDKMTEQEFRLMRLYYDIKIVKQNGQNRDVLFEKQLSTLGGVEAQYRATVSTPYIAESTDLGDSQVISHQINTIEQRTELVIKPKLVKGGISTYISFMIPTSDVSFSNEEADGLKIELPSNGYITLQSSASIDLETLKSGKAKVYLSLPGLNPHQSDLDAEITIRDTLAQ